MDKVSLLDTYLKSAGVNSSFDQVVNAEMIRQNIPSIWDETQGEGIKIAVLDTGCQYDHVDLQGSIAFKFSMTQARKAYSYLSWARYWKKQVRLYQKRLKRTRNTKKRNGMRKNLKSAQKKVTYFVRRFKAARSNVSDAHGHGSHVTGIITANNNAEGIVGVAPRARVQVIKVLNDQGYGSYDWVSGGIEKALSLGCDIISMSLGGTYDHPGMRKMVDKAYARNVPIICAAGNSGDKGVLDYPGNYKKTIAIGALDKNNLRAGFSQTGENLDFMAPGVNILSTVPKDSYAAYSGTSMATPWVAGVVALMLAKHRKIGGKTPVDTVAQIKDHLKWASIDLDKAGKDEKTGYGLIDVKKAINELV
jgi:subtilisin family serine protease